MKKAMFVLIVLVFANTYSADSKDTASCCTPDPSKPLKKVFRIPRRSIEAAASAHKKTKGNKPPKKVHWADDSPNSQNLAVEHELDPLDPECMFQMHHFRLPNERAKKRKTNIKTNRWYDKLSPEEQIKYQKEELNIRSLRKPDNPEEKKILDEMKKSGIKIKIKPDKNRGLKLEELKKENPTLFEKKQ